MADPSAAKTHTEKPATYEPYRCSECDRIRGLCPDCAAQDRLLVADDSEIEVVDDKARAVWEKPERGVVYTREDYERDKKARERRGS